MRRETGRLVDNEMSETALQENLVRNHPAPARVEDVAVKKQGCSPSGC